MNRHALPFLLTLNALLLGGIYLTAGPVAPAGAQGGGGGIGRYTLMSSRSDGLRDESTIFVIDKQTSAMVPLQFSDSQDRFSLRRGRVLYEDAEAFAGEEPERP